MTDESKEARGVGAGGRLIDAERLSAVLQKNFGHTGGAAVLQRLIDIAPTADPVKHGHWINIYGDYSAAECSACRGVLDAVSDRPCRELWEAFLELYRFCPFCGARMDGDGEEK